MTEDPGSYWARELRATADLLDRRREESLRALEGAGVDHDPATGEVRGAPDANPKTRVGGMNKAPLHLIPTRPMPAIALAFADGGFKYAPYNWRSEPITASVYYGAALRHLTAWWEGETVPPDGVAPHLAHVIACLLMILDTEGTPMFQDNRPPRLGAYSELLDAAASHLAELRARDSTLFELHEIR